MFCHSNKDSPKLGSTIRFVKDNLGAAPSCRALVRLLLAPRSAEEESPCTVIMHGNSVAINKAVNNCEDIDTDVGEDIEDDDDDIVEEEDVRSILIVLVFLCVFVGIWKDMKNSSEVK